MLENNEQRRENKRFKSTITRYGTRWNQSAILRHAKAHGGRFRSFSTERDNTPIDRAAWGGNSANDAGAVLTTAPDISPQFHHYENREPLKVRFTTRRVRRGLLRWFVKVYRYFWPRLTYSQKQELKRIKAREQLRAVRELDTARAIPKVEEALLDMDFATRRTINGLELLTGAYRVFDAHSTPHEIYLHFPTHPRGMKNSYVAASDEDVITNIQTKLGYQVQSVVDKQSDGLTYVIHIASEFGLPDLVEYADIIQRRRDSAGPFTVPLGQSSGAADEWVDLTDGPHWMFAGSTGKGKTNMLHCVLSTLIQFAKPSDCRLLFVDLKRTELILYRGAPHLLTGEVSEAPDGIARTSESALAVLRYARTLCDKRYEMLEGSGMVGIAEYNAKRKVGRLPRIFVVIDEYSDIANSEYHDEADACLAKIGQIGRSAGVHVIFCTQQPYREVITSRATSNIEGRIGFFVPTVPASMITVNGPEAAQITPAGHPGRGFVRHRNRSSYIQTPFLPTDQVRAIVSAVINGRTVDYNALSEWISPEEIVSWSADNNNGDMGTREIYEQFKGRIGKNKLEDLVHDMEGKTFTAYDGEHYTVMPAANPLPRRLKRVTTHPAGAEMSGQDAGQQAEEKKNPEPEPAAETTAPAEPEPESTAEPVDPEEELYAKTVDAVLSSSKGVSINWIQNKMRVGYNRAARLMDRMIERGIVSHEMDTNGKRKVLR